MQSALDGYRSALQALKGRGGARQRAGALEAAQRELEQLPLPASLGAAVAILKELFQDCEDVVFRGVLIGGRRPALVLFIDGIVEAERLELSVLEPLTRWGDPDRVPGAAGDLRAWLEAVAVSINQAQLVETVGQVVDAVLGGDAVLLVDGVDHGVKLAARGWKARAVEEPISEATIRGPRDGFNEALRVNTALIRRRLRSPHLKMEQFVIGRRTRTAVDVIYLKDVANPTLVAEVKSRVQRIDIDGFTDTGMLEEFIEDQPTSPFPQVITTERPDRVTAALLEGQVAILADGSPFALIMPVTFWSFMTASEDYYLRFWYGTLALWLRLLFLILSLVGPSLYIAFTTYHQEVIPTSLLLALAAAREGIPFPAVVEALILEIFFEAFREAGIRLPRTVGQAVSIVGALIIGEAAVDARLATAPLVMTVAATGIASFTFPSYGMGIALRMLRFLIMLLAGTLGLFGVVVGLVAILVHLCALRSFGVPYLQGLAPFTWSDVKDTLARFPLWLMGRRPAAFEAVNRRRQAPWLRPGPEGDGP